jgi:hypothetical protein
MTTIETIDEFRRRTNSSYDDARYYLDRHNGDLLEAIIEYERTSCGKGGNACGEESHSGERRSGERRSGDFGRAVMAAVQRLLDIRLTITDKSDRSISIPILFPIMVFPLWHVMILAGIGMMIMGFKFGIREIRDENFNLECIIARIRDKARARSQQ